VKDGPLRRVAQTEKWRLRQVRWFHAACADRRTTPRPDEGLSIIEVADSSFACDRNAKRSPLPGPVSRSSVNLTAAEVEVCREPQVLTLQVRLTRAHASVHEDAKGPSAIAP
jgi:hypothetical protein